MSQSLYWLIESTVVFTALFAVVLLVKRIFAKQLSAAMHLLLWGIVLVKLLIPVTITAAWSPGSLFGGLQSGLPVTAAVDQSLLQKGSADKPVSSDSGYLLNADDKTGTAGRDTPAKNAGKRKYGMPAPLQNTPEINWDTLIIALWFTGFAATLLVLGIRAHALKKKVVLCSRAKTPEWLNALYTECKLSAGVHGRVALAVQDILKAPAVMGVFRPVLVLSESLVNSRDTERLRHVLLHELCHCKKNDLAWIWLLNAVSAAYWFNPLVLIFTRLVQRDMETACDVRTVELLGRENRKAYIETILHFSMERPAVRLKAALSLNDGCTEAKKRIEGMFLKRRTKPL